VAPSVPPAAVTSKALSDFEARNVDAFERIDDADDGQSSRTFRGEYSIKNSRNASLVDDVDGREETQGFLIDLDRRRGPDMSASRQVGTEDIERRAGRLHAARVRFGERLLSDRKKDSYAAPA
jgi:hypothetical protein